MFKGQPAWDTWQPGGKKDGEMEKVFKRIKNRMVSAAGLMLGLSKRIDYKTLNRYVIGMNESLTLDHVLLEASRCLKDILNYQLFAFAVQDGERLDVWIDPRMYQKPLSRVIERDFGADSPRQNIHFFTDDGRDMAVSMAFHGERLLSRVIMDTGGGLARLYVLPQRRMMPYHDEILGTIVKTLGVALNNCLNIKRLESDAALDPLTGCYNRREFDRLIEHHIAGARRHGKALSLIMFDVDHFKEVNDTFGHSAGDAVLAQIAATVRSTIRKGDYLVRYGGEEFIAVLPDTESLRAVELAGRLRRILENHDIRLPDGRAIRKTASFGIACYQKGWSADRLVNEADHLMYQAKALGRNRVMPKLKGHTRDCQGEIAYNLEDLTSCAMIN
jgi:diguanylate cyclase (GGDEF)-like protein